MAGRFFRMSNLHHVLIAFHCALSTRAHSRATRCWSIVEVGKLSSEAGQPKDFPVIRVLSPSLHIWKKVELGSTSCPAHFICGCIRFDRVGLCTRSFEP